LDIKTSSIDLGEVTTSTGITISKEEELIPIRVIWRRP
jgi:hypothetical protein